MAIYDVGGNGSNCRLRKMYVLQGCPNCGKSSTIKEIYNILSNNYPNSTIHNYFQAQPPAQDIKITMNGVKQHLIGIESQGDPNSRLAQSLDDFDKAGCDIIFCASRSTGTTVNVVKSYSNNYQIFFIDQLFLDKNLISNNNPNQSLRDKCVAQLIISIAGL
jgi:basic membrane lipoprotein Med (substrate-binding protein (PBP1-ABC) superfamily)